MAKRVLLEVCVESVDDALAAVAGGADRLEVNSALALGGLTPSAGLLGEIRRAVAVPLIAMIRPRPAGFCYSTNEFKVMLRDAETLLAAGADGIAFGVLTAAGRVNVARCRRLRELCGLRAAVFHRAFDVTPEPLAALDVLIDLGFQRLMTSGQEETAYNGIALIGDLIRRSAGRIEVLPAGGINRFTVADVVTRTGCNQIHASLRTAARDTTIAARPQVRFARAGSVADDRVERTSQAAVAEIKAMLSKV